MIRKFVPVMVAAVALLAAFAATASASTFTAEKYPATIEGTQLGEHIFQVETGLRVNCKTATFHGTLAEASSTISISPTYKECVAFGFINATINFHGCTYLFHAGELVEADRYSGTVDIVCPAGKTIEIWSGTCETRIPPQTGLSSNDITNNTNPKDAIATGSLTGVEYVKTKDGFACPLNGTGTKTDGAYYGEATAIGKEASSPFFQVGISVS
jgi:hypothetical protein